MSTPFTNPKQTSMETDFRPWYNPDPNLDFSAFQDISQNESEALYRQYPLGKMVIDAQTRMVIGKGLTPMSSPETDITGWTEEQTAKFVRQAEAYWRLVTNDRNFDYYGKNDFKQLEQIAFRNIMMAGDTLSHWGFRRLRNGSVVPYVQLISGRMVTQNADPDTLDETGGVKLDSRTGRETGYRVRVIGDNREDTVQTRLFSRYNAKTGRLEYDLIQLQKTDPSLVRGIPLLTALRGAILGTSKFQDNHLLQSIVQNMFSVFIEKEEETQGPSLADKLKGAGAKQDPIDKGKMNLRSGNIIPLEPKEHAVLVQRQAQGEDYSKYLTANIEIIAGACGLSAETVLNRYNASFSASRAGIASTEKNNEILREEFVQKFCEPTWAQVIDVGVLSGMIEAPGYLEDRMIRKAALATTWTGPTPAQVDPVKEVNAYIAAIGAGLCTHEYAIRRLYGMDFEEVTERLAKETTQYEKLGITTKNALIPVADEEKTTEETPDEKE